MSLASFHYVDRIYDYAPRRYIRGLKNVTRNEGLYYWLPSGERVLSPAVISESLAQLGGWLKMASTDFTHRPVLLADEKTEYLGFATAGDQIDLSVEVVDFRDDVVVTKGIAKIRGETIVIGHCCRGYLLPLEDFSEPSATKKQFQNLYKPEFKDLVPPARPLMQLPAAAGARTFDILRYLDGLIEHQPYEKVVAFKNVCAAEPYFATHFPRKPCVPGVLLLTFVGEACQYLLKESIHAPVRERALIPTFIQNVRFRKFVEPGDQCMIQVDVKEGDPRQAGNDILVKAMLFANGNRVLQAEMGFRVMHQSVPFVWHKTPETAPS